MIANHVEFGDCRAIEPAWGADTRRQIIAMGLWPASLVRMEGEDGQ